MSSRFACLIIILWAVYAAAQTTIIEGKVITGSERWSGTVIVEGDVEIKPSGRLEIDPGTRILFRAGMDKRKSGKDKTRIEIIVRGVLTARGTITNKIRFTSAEPQPRMGDWYGIIVMNSKHTCIIEYSIIEYAYNGINIKQCNPPISNSQIQFNYNAGLIIELKAAPKILGNIISENGYAGIICNKGANPILSDNMIIKNEIGLISFGTARPNLGDLSDGPNYNQGRNGIFENLKYNIHNHSENDIKAENVSWGTKEAADIALSIYDAAEDRKYGQVDIEPILGGGLNLDKKILLSQSTPADETLLNEARQTDNIIPQTVISREDSAPTGRVPQDSLLAARNISSNQERLPDTTSGAALKVPAGRADSALLTAADNRPEQVIETQPDIIETKEPEIDYNQVFLDAFLENGRTITKKVRPVITDKRRGLNARGRIIVRVIVGKMGRVESAGILKGLNPYYDDLALEASKKFEFSQGTIKGVPVRFSTSLFFEF